MLVFNELKNKSRIYYSAILLGQFISYEKRKTCREILTVILITTLFLVILIPYLDKSFFQLFFSDSVATFLFENLFRVRSIFIIFFVTWLVGYLAEAFYLSNYFKRGEVDFEVAKLVYTSNQNDMTLSFIKSQVGQYIMDKLGITDQQIKFFIKDDRRIKIKARDLRFDYNTRNIPNDDDRVVNLSDYLKTLYDEDEFLQDFFMKSNVSEEEFFGALNWVQNIIWKMRNKERFWSKENLMRIPSVGRNWYLEDIDYLKRCAHLIYEDQIYQSLGKDWHMFRDEAETVESFLMDETFNNVMLVGEDVSIGMQVVSTFGKMIAEGYCLNKFENKKLYVLNTDILLSHSHEAEDLRKNFLDILYHADKSPDVILVFPNLSDFIEKAFEFNLDIIEVIKDVLKVKEVPVIAVIDKADFYSVVESDFEMMKLFDKYVIPKVDKDFVLRVLQNEAHKIENKDGKNITFPVLNKIAEKHLSESDPIKSSLVELHRIYE